MFACVGEKQEIDVFECKYNFNAFIINQKYFYLSLNLMPLEKPNKYFRFPIRIVFNKNVVCLAYIYDWIC